MSTLLWQEVFVPACQAHFCCWSWRKTSEGNAGRMFYLAAGACLKDQPFFSAFIPMERRPFSRYLNLRPNVVMLSCITRLSAVRQTICLKWTLTCVVGQNVLGISGVKLQSDKVFKPFAGNVHQGTESLHKHPVEFTTTADLKESPHIINWQLDIAMILSKLFVTIRNI